MESPIIVTGIRWAARDFLVSGHPYIPTVPRTKHSLALITDGIMRYTCCGQTTVITRGEVLFIRTGHIDRAEPDAAAPVRYITVDFTTTDDDFALDRVCGGSEAYLLPLFTHIVQTYEEHGIDWMMGGIGTLYRILTYLRHVKPQNGSSTYSYKRIVPAMEMLKNRLSDPELTVSAMAEACRITTVSLNRCFHTLYGMSVSKYVMNRRMETAKDLLLNSSNTVGEVAREVGFRDVYSFSHAFTRINGVSPQLWRSWPEPNGRGSSAFDEDLPL